MYCSQCGKEAKNEAVVCVHCGCALNSVTNQNVKFCKHCGNEVHPEAVVCVKCGSAIKNTNSQFENEYAVKGFHSGYMNTNMILNSQLLVDSISQRILINGIIWIVIAAIQMLLGLFLGMLFIVGIVNLIYALADLRLSKEYRMRPVSLVNRVEPLAGPIIILIYNIIFGGIVGIAGSIYYLVAIRKSVMDNKMEYLDIEIKYI